MKRHATLRIAAAGLLALLLSVSATLPSMASSGASVAVSVTVRHALTVTFTDSGVLVSANGPWTLSAVLPSGESFVYSGDACVDQLVSVPGNAISVDVYPR